MASPQQELRKIRLDKLNQLRAQGVDPFPIDPKRTHTTSEALKSPSQSVIVAGRLTSLRSHGKIVFADLCDNYGQIQLLFKSDSLSQKEFELISLCDIGDFFQAEGKVFTTKSGQITIDVVKFQILAKSLLPTPSEYYGLADIETRLRKRYLDILTNPETKQIFIKKTSFGVQSVNFWLKMNF